MDEKELYQALISSTGTSNALATLLQATYSDLRADMRSLESKVEGKLERVEHEFDERLEKMGAQLTELLAKKSFREHMIRLVEYVAIVGVSIFGAWDWIEAHIISKVR